MSIVRLTLTILGTVVYLGLAILGWCGTAAFFRPAGVDLARDGAVRSRRGGGVRRRQSEPRPASGSRQPLGPCRLRVDRPASGISAGFDGDAVRWIGVILFAGSGALRICPFLCLADGSVGWWRSSQGTLWRQTVPIASSAIRAIWDFWSARWDGIWHSARRWVCCWLRSSSRRSWPAFERKKGCSIRSSGASTRRTARGGGGYFQGSSSHLRYYENRSSFGGNRRHRRCTSLGGFLTCFGQSGRLAND